ncbi:hypothetical protein [Nocardioides sp. cx-173]|uniref:hypothetical protein n=1 Tax=Nocardioides sp. cx-173 TaxID=2898796 RepID=UPI001E2D87F5|nr:hypothetical protein [Nocardioides sp. cx-173]MCD4526074.1 hypothetical protein [Nocardioides sp. cx-173]UGB43766.1 hypothetical protein LQ940_09650 [Nocardioides sp. cx-173]
MTVTWRALALGLALALSVSSCSSDAGEPQAAPETPQPPTPSSEAVPCTVAGFSPEEKTVLHRRSAVVLYAATHEMSPGTAASGKEMLSRYDLAPVRVTSSSSEVPEELRRAVLGAAGPAWPRSGPPQESGPFSYDVSNDTANQFRRFVRYQGAGALHGSWSATRCGAPYNDGSQVVRLTGKFSTVSVPQRPRTHVCGSVTRDEYDRAATRACRL